MLFVKGNDFDISSVREISKTNPCLDKYGERGKVKGAVHVFIYRLWGGRPFFFRGGDFSVFRGKGGWISCY